MPTHEGTIAARPLTSSVDLQREIEATSTAIAELKAARLELAAEAQYVALDDNATKIASLSARLEALQEAKQVAERRERDATLRDRERRVAALIALKDKHVAAYQEALTAARAVLSQATVNEAMRCYREASAICSDTFAMTQDHRHHAASLGIPSARLGIGAQRFLILAPRTPAGRSVWLDLLDPELPVKF